MSIWITLNLRWIIRAPPPLLTATASILHHCVISAFPSQQSQFVLHHQVWITHHFTLSWICKVIEQNKCQNLYLYYIQTGVWVTVAVGVRFWPFKMSSKPMDSSLPRRVSTARFELVKNGSRWIWRSSDIKNKRYISKHVKGSKRAVYMSERETRPVTCRAALYSICSLRGAWRPWMFRSVEKLILSLFSWNCKPNHRSHLSATSV